MEVVTRATSSAAKRFITHQDDRFRPPYEKHLIDGLDNACLLEPSIQFQGRVT